MQIRRARPEDGPAFLALVHELASFEKLPGPTPEAGARLVRDAFGTDRRFDLLVAELAGRVVSYAVVFETYSTFLAAPILYLEDIYVTPDARRQGVASAMMRALAQEALARGCARLSWVVLDWNVEAQRFYERLGAGPVRAWVPFKVEGDALARLAAQGSR